MENADEERTTLDQLMQPADSLPKFPILLFKGIPIRVDPNLQGKQFYCMVSPEVYKELQEINDK